MIQHAKAFVRFYGNHRKRRKLYYCLLFIAFIDIAFLFVLYLYLKDIWPGPDFPFLKHDDCLPGGPGSFPPLIARGEDPNEHVWEDCGQRQGNFYKKNALTFTGEKGWAVVEKHLKFIFMDFYLGPINVIDVGANIDPILLNDEKFMAIHEKSKFYLFEPNPVNVGILERTFSNQTSHGSLVYIFPNAVSNETGTAAFFFNHEDNDDGNAHGSLLDLRDEQKLQAQKVSMVTLDDIMKDQKIEHLHLLKIDTEGFDVNVLRGAKKLLQKTDVIVFECNNFSKDYTWQDVGDELLKDGFRLFLLHRTYIYPINGVFYHPVYDEMSQWQNCLLLKDSYPHTARLFSGLRSVCGCPWQPFTQIFS